MSQFNQQKAQIKHHENKINKTAKPLNQLCKRKRCSGWM